jgi:hypothetical protein
MIPLKALIIAPQFVAAGHLRNLADRTPAECSPLRFL